MQHHAATDFWRQYLALPREIRARADQCFSLLKADARHPSLQFKKVGERRGQEIWSARITLSIALWRSNVTTDICGSGLAITKPMTG
jgi:hypothetical protein